MATINQQGIAELSQRHSSSVIGSPSTKTITSSFDITNPLAILCLIGALVLLIGLIIASVVVYRKLSKKKQVFDEGKYRQVGKSMWYVDHKGESLDNQPSTSGGLIKYNNESPAAFQRGGHIRTPVRSTTRHPIQPTPLKPTLTAEEQEWVNQVDLGLSERVRKFLIAWHTSHINRLTPLVNNGSEPQVDDPKTLEELPLRGQIQAAMCEIDQNTEPFPGWVQKLDGYLRGLAPGEMQQRVQEVRQKIISWNSVLMGYQQQYEQLLTTLRSNQPNGHF
ncbi:hypothetical protein NEHOM01_0482 [Nematocida homosporus]|uniref:uncharacterized protein n=1 Tax=Nematocida homosporus TaxID=1912981 RepID=UPI002220B406|nr:uncharacterized protein NEHOM01_0482 [Nematocida homosporus]KAI5184931.1 hypothetical protein NEHOM01_0482 [Nematocida homosporus]